MMRRFLFSLLLFFSTQAICTSYCDEVWQKAHQGGSVAQFNLAILFSPLAYELSLSHCDQDAFYANHQCHKKNAERYFYWMKKSAEGGNIGAITHLGYIYSNGIGVERNIDLALNYYTQAAEQGDAIAQYNLASLYSNNVDIQPDYQLAQYWYLKAIENGRLMAKVSLANMYLKQHKHVEEAVSWLTRLDKLSPKHIESIWASGYLAQYYHSIGDDEKAVLFYRKTIGKIPFDQINTNNELENKYHYSIYPLPYAQVNLAWLILNGKGTEQDLEEAITLFYSGYQDFLRLAPEKVEILLNLPYENQMEKDWTVMLLNELRGKRNHRANQRLFKILFPKQPRALSQFYQQIARLSHSSRNNPVR